VRRSAGTRIPVFRYRGDSWTGRQDARGLQGHGCEVAVERRRPVACWPMRSTFSGVSDGDFNRMKRRQLARNASLVLASIVFGMVVVETTIRLRAQLDENGNRFIGRAAMTPYHLPVRTLRSVVDVYQTTHPVQCYDETTGWTNRPNSSGAYFDGRTYRHGTDGIRAPVETTVFQRERVDKVLRIAVFGDSFTYGLESDFDDTWPHLLEERLRVGGTPAEVLNFGVGGYGMDQAYLRWDSVGKQYHPEIVVFGFQFENVWRNLTFFWPLYVLNVPFAPAWTLGANPLPFSKPRIVFEQDQPRFINLPALPPSGVPDAIAAYVEGSSSLAPLDAMFERRYYEPTFWDYSRAGSVLRSFMVMENERRRRAQLAILDGPGGKNALSIIELFRRRVGESGAKFFVVELPNRELASGKPERLSKISNAEMVRYGDALAPRGAFIRTLPAFRERGGDSHVGFWARLGHYARGGNEVVAEHVAAAILAAAGRRDP
jgi:hypothetical protein